MLTVWSSTQNPHPLRVFLAASLGMGENQVRVIQPHVGGGFGEKVPPFPEEIVIGYAARSLRRPLKWIEERTEHFLAGGHAREISFDFEAGYKKDGQVTALAVTMYADVGVASTLVGWAMAYVSAYCVPTASRFQTAVWNYSRSLLTSALGMVIALSAKRPRHISWIESWIGWPTPLESSVPRCG